jgi:protein-disulfide isomerase
MAAKSPPRPGNRPPARPLGGNRSRRAIEARRRRNQWVAGGIVAFFVLTAVAGFAIQSNRSKVTHAATGVVVPAHPLGPSGSELLGSPSAPVLVEEHGDFQCPNCGQFEKLTGPTIRELVNEGKIRFAFHPFLFIGSESFAEANAAECAGDVGKFWPVHDYLYAHQAPENSGYWTTDRLLAVLKSLGADTPQVTQCVTSQKYVPWLQQITDQGSQRGVNATPTVYVNGKVLNDLSPRGLIAAVTAALAAKP